MNSPQSGTDAADLLDDDQPLTPVPDPLLPARSGSAGSADRDAGFDPGSEQDSAAAENRERSRILVVEDSYVQAAGLCGILQADGFDVAIAVDGQRAFDLVQSEKFDLVISDVMMPELCGYELCRKIKADAAVREIPVILLTSLSDPMDIIRGLECGADNFLTKPYQATELLSRVRTVLHNRPLRSERLKGGAEVTFLGTTLNINSDREQILDLLLTTFEEIHQTNSQLQAAQTELLAAQETVNRYAQQLEEKVRASEDKYRRLMQQASDAIFIFDPQGIVLEANQRAERLLGRAVQDLVGHSYEQFVPESELGHYRKLVEKLRTEDCLVGGDVHLRRADGKLVAIDYSCSRVDLEGEPVVLAIVHDATQRNQLTRQLHQAQKMDAIGRLAGGVAHDFNNLLTIISGYSDLLLASNLPPEACALIEEIHHAGERAADLTHQLLAFGRQQMRAPQVLDLNGIVSNTEKMLRRLIGEDIELTLVAGAALDFVKADQAQIEQIIVNLAINSRDAMPQGGQLTIETSNVTLRESYAQFQPELAPGRYVVLTVSDTGCGMDAATQARLFEPFFTTKEPGKGTGLGLPTVYGIVQQNGGRIHVYSEVAVGTTFKVYLPSVNEQLLPALGVAGSVETARGHETVLLVEDEAVVRKFTKRVLQKYGYTVLEASRGTEAIRICQEYQGPIQIVVSDVVMPEMGGRVLMEQLVRIRPEIKVLFMSGYTDDAVVRHGILEADTPFLQKPFMPIDLISKVQDVLARE